MTLPSEPSPENTRPHLPPEIRRRVLLSWASLIAERLYPVLWPASGVIGVFLILALANTFSYLPEWLHLLLLVAFFACTVWAVMWSLRKSSVPTHAQAVRHLEQSSGMEHRPLSALEDHPAIAGDNDTKQLWRAHQRWIYAHLHKLRVAWPKLSLAAKDPHSLRILLGLAIATLTIANWSDASLRIYAALSPGFAQGRPPSTVEAWVTPPAYTNEPPLHLTAKTARGLSGELQVAAGSILTVRTHGASSAVLRVSTIGGNTPRQLRPQFMPAGGDARDATLTIDSDVSVKLAVNASNSGQWTFKIKSDTAPRIRFKSPVTSTQTQSLRFHYEVEDDYGVAAARAIIQLDRAPPAKTNNPDALTFELPLPPAPARTGEVIVFRDLTDHAWAGLRVKIVLAAKDQKGQEERTKPFTLVLPERVFEQPFARALVEQRRLLSRDPKSSGNVAKALDALAISPERFIPDSRMYLALRTATFEVHRARLDATRIDNARLTSARQILWDLAMRVEKGDSAQAQAELRDIQRRLMEAMARGAPQHEIEQLMAQLRSALERSLRALADRSNAANSLMQSANGQVIRPQDLQAMLEKIQELTRQGSMAAAQQELSKLLDLLENIQTAGGGQMSPEQKAAAQSLEKMGQILSQQRKLMDDTYRERMETEDRPNSKPSPLQEPQARLGDELNPIIKSMKQNSEASAALRRAQDAMDAAADQLGTGDLSGAGKSQKQALEQLRKGGQAMVQQMLQQMAGQGASVPQSAGGGGGDNEDPFGRPQSSSGPTSGNSVRVPDKADIQRAREIMQELQRRAGERGRPDLELEYIERLLRRF